MHKPQRTERRGKGRLKLRLPVQLRLPDGQQLALVTENLSDSGIFLCCEPEQMPAVGTEVVLWLEAMPFDPPEVPAVVVHHGEGGFGVRFLLDKTFDDA